MDFQEFKAAVIRCCRERGIEEYELYYQRAESTSVAAFQREINQFTGAIEGGVCFRCILGGKMGYASTEALSREQAEAVVARAADNAAALEAEEPVFLGEGGKTYLPLEDAGITMPTTEKLIQKVLQTQKQIYAADAAVIDGSTTQGVAERSTVSICNSRGLDLTCETTLAGLVVAAVVSDGSEMANDYQVKLGDLDAIDGGALARKAAAAALGKLGGEVAPTGQYPVVFGPEAMCDLIATFSPIFSAENARKGLSRLAGKEGSPIAAPAVTLVDDPFCPANPVRRNFDAEGSPTFPKKLIEGGVFRTLLHNLKTANLAGMETTGNAAKAGYDAPVGIRPFTLYLEPGSLTEAALLEKAGKGVYIHTLGGLHAGANTVSGDFSLQSAGFLIEGGKKTTPVKSFTVAGNFYDLLQNIAGLSDTLEFPGMGNVGSPWVLVQGLSVAGK